MRNLPPLVAVKAFVAVGRFKSYRRAADALGVDHTVISRHVRNLEDWVGVQLIQRIDNKTTLTTEGARFFEQVSLSFNILESATQEVRSPARSGELRLWCVGGLAADWLSPRIGMLQAVLPRVEIVIRPTRNLPDFARRDADCAIHYNVREEKGVRHQQLAAPRFFPVANRAFLEKHGRPKSFEDLAKLQLLHEDSREQWREWLEAVGVDMSNISLAGPRLWYANVALEAAALGQGVALTNVFIAARALKDGLVEVVLPSNIHLGSYVLHALESRWNDPIIARLRKWLLSELSADIKLEEEFGILGNRRAVDA